MFEIHSGVLTPEMRDALWGSPKSDAWHVFSGLRRCSNCQGLVNTPNGFPDNLIPKHDPCIKRPETRETEDGRIVVVDHNLPQIDPVNTKELETELNSLYHKGVTRTEIDRARPLLQTLLTEMIPA